MKLTRYYAWFPGKLLVGPFYRRVKAEQTARGHTSDPLLWGIIWQGGGHVLTRQQVKRIPPSPPRPSAPDLMAYAHTHVTSPGAHAILDEVERGRARQEGGVSHEELA